MNVKSARALFRRREIGTALLERWIDQRHVGTPNAQIADEVRSRIGTQESANVIEAAVVIALARHESNRALYRRVTGAI
jgi:hypothetical protein